MKSKDNSLKKDTNKKSAESIKSELLDIAERLYYILANRGCYCEKKCKCGVQDILKRFENEYIRQ